jgi:hypothetical protein
MLDVGNLLPDGDGNVAQNDTSKKYNALNPVVVSLTFDGKGQAGGKLISKKFIINRVVIDERESIEITFLGTGNLRNFTVFIPVEFAKYLAPALFLVTDGTALSNETNTAINVVSYPFVLIPYSTTFSACSRG